MSRREVTLKQDTQHCINIFGRAMSAIERYMVFLNLPIRRIATYYDGTHVNPREVPEAHLIEEMKMQLTVAYASLHTFITTYGSGPKELIAEFGLMRSNRF
ncbi:hypothetical protein Pelo_19803 [Pelomyxa schiedti]|nr:hypothetical protein Pelo_19803 [Pelomyxa schiedti]